MRCSISLRLLAFVSVLMSGGACAESVIAEGAAPISSGNDQYAREEALRNALSEAVRQTSLRVGATVGVKNSLLTSDQVVIKSSGLVRNHRIIDERQDGDVYRVSILAELDVDSAHQDAGACREGHTKRLLIGGFPLRRPEQLRFDELSGYGPLTASELAQRFPKQAAVFVDFSGDTWVRYDVPERVDGPVALGSQGWSVIRAATRLHRAQYLMIGQFHSVAASADEKKREIDLEALIFDASTGSCVARRRFHRTAAGRIRIPRSIVFGSAAHYATDFGRAYADLLDEVARWADATTSCLPFSARVLKVDGNSIYIDAGAESGIAVGDTFSVFRPAKQPIVTPSGEVLGVEKRPLGEMSVTTVYPRFAIGELKARGAGVVAAIDDELYGH